MFQLSIVCAALLLLLLRVNDIFINYVALKRIFAENSPTAIGNARARAMRCCAALTKHVLMIIM